MFLYVRGLPSVLTGLYYFITLTYMGLLFYSIYSRSIIIIVTALSDTLRIKNAIKVLLLFF